MILYQKLCKNIAFNCSRNFCFGYLLASPHCSDSHKYSKSLLYGEIRIKQAFSFISFCCVQGLFTIFSSYEKKKVREKSRECHNHKPQPLPDTKRKGKPTKPKKHKSNRRTKGTKISSLFPKRGNRNAKRIDNSRTK